ncbi:XdhC family protein [Candidatus Halobonum tyrrellensis]|uniref:Xanthine and CO dehydrogenases maturation factor, XdhC/CoxF family protein n=1 Tax=Candidatus Halobonum tyrrellensis G22 TaxID=1324957 RepID=V4HJZ0_9EURY|nr:XdhC/CoxI family protein [Candidatus Halobonum tyrrellensis]ESP90093.1 xanthine and CO dehydrogenases maturation factor, XdhC/CoxF family protein [Candidatus Halobonum tyrrellensis G22]
MRSPDRPPGTTASGVRESMRDRLGDEGVAVATVVAVEGSGYRRPGARMVVDPEGTHRGSVTAGCLEESVRDIAARVVTDGDPRLERFDLRDDAVEGWGLGLGCNGVIDVLVEPLDASFGPALAELEATRPVTVLTAVGSTDPAVDAGDRTTLTGAGRVSPGRDPLPEAVADAAERRLDGTDADVAARLSVGTDAGEVDVFANRLVPTPTLLVFGGQADADPVASLALRAGFRVRVATARGGRADDGRFPDAVDVRSTHPAEVADAVDAPAYTYAVVMSHNFVDDRLAVAALLDTDVPYVGVMGPRERFRDLRESMDRTLDAADRDRIAAPCGLDLGGDDPAAIGFSVVSEVVAVHNGRAGGRLTDLEGPIHDRSEVP